VIQRYLTIIVFFLSVLLSLTGCVSSEETGAGDRAKTPVQIFGPIDTTRRVTRREVRRDTLAKPKIDSIKLTTAKRPRIAPKFKSRQDTVRASVVTKAKSPAHPRIKIERPEHPLYTVQIGAFGRVANALRSQKKAKERFTDQPVFNNYVKGAKMYRVSVGRYENRKEAFALSDTMKQNFPNEYHECWINFIP
jgi:septal ring-binding cell division protein DamX